MNWFNALGPSLLMVLGGIITWIIKSRIEELRATEERLTEACKKIYGEILEPFVTLFADIQGKGPDEAVKVLMSRDYRRTALELNLFGSDEVVRAYNALMQHSYKVKTDSKQDPKLIMTLWGRLLLEIRRSLGNKNTTLAEVDMLEGMITNIRKYL